MSSNRRNRPRRPARRDPWRDPKPLILCVCEGKKTEPQYLKAFTAYCRNPRVRLQVEPGPGVPRTLVDRAKLMKRDAERESKRQKDGWLAFDEVWCVFDVDEHPRLDEARVMARDNGISLAVSNPSFELWLLLHFRDDPGAQTRDTLLESLKAFIPDYDKNIQFQHWENGYSQAVTRARTLDKIAFDAGQEGRNPTTGVWRLTESIRGDEEN